MVEKAENALKLNKTFFISYNKENVFTLENCILALLYPDSVHFLVSFFL